jgi:predicted RNase H-like nuclease
MMRTVLGIDAAWTTTQPSGVALVTETDGGWHLSAVAASFSDFYRLGDLGPTCGFDAAALIEVCAKLSGAPPTAVTVDMPLATAPITGRRLSDNLVSVAYGARSASTHSPSVTRPGPVSAIFVEGFAALGYSLQTSAPVSGGLIEVYPHPALIELMAASKRLPYKIHNAKKYWPECPPAERRLSILSEWAAIILQLESRISNCESLLPAPSPGSSLKILKGYEDKLDAAVCAWIGVCALGGQAIPFGDAQSAIWIPTPST